MATVRHHLCRIDFDPTDVMNTVKIRVSDLDGVEIDTIDVRSTHLISAVMKMVQVLTRRNVALARMIGEMDDEVNGVDIAKVGELRHAQVCSTLDPHTSEQCRPIDTPARSLD